MKYVRSIECRNTAYDRDALDDTQRRGWSTFSGKGGCATCHAPPYFTSAAGADVKPKPPTLRDVLRTGPYLHDGTVPELADAARHEGTNPALTAAEHADILAFLGALTCE